MERDGKKWFKATGFADQPHTAAHELWRRTRCNACSVQRGAQYSAEPRDLHGAQALTGRFFPYKQQFRSITRDSKYLWLATEDLIYQIDLATKTMVKTYDRSIGLGSQPFLELLSDGKTLWILSRGSAAALPIGQEKTIPLSIPKFQFARLCSSDTGTWVITDSGTYRYTSPEQAPQIFPALPTGKRIASEIEKGMWLPAWKRNTAYYLVLPVIIGQRLYVSSFLDVYELADGVWNKVIPGGTQHQVQNGRLWALAGEGLVEYDPATKTSKTHVAKELTGRLTGLVVTKTDAWISAEPVPDAKGENFTGGGLARMDLANGQWQCWQTIDGMDASHSMLQLGQDGAIWDVRHQGGYKVLSAHPGMTFVTKTLFAASGFGLHRWDAVNKTWQTTPLPSLILEKRFICGQDGQGADVEISPQSIESICVTADRVFASARLVPVGSFSGYWPCIEPIAKRDACGKWTAAFEHHPEQLNQQGEQPLILNISNKGEMILGAVGHDDVVDMFLNDGQPWTVTENCVAWFDTAKDTWHKVAELGYNFYWRPTAILDEGDTVFVGGDRGTVSQLDLKTGTCRILGGLKNRRISQIVRQDGKLVIAGIQPPPGLLPVYGLGNFNLLDSDAAIWDGKTLVALDAAPSLPVVAPMRWKFQPTEVDPNMNPPFRREQIIGNMLWGPESDGKLIPRYYFKEIYAPTVLDFGMESKRIWCSVFGGLFVVDLPKAEVAR